MKRVFPLLLLLFAAAVTTGCASPESWVIISVRDGLSRAPLPNPVLTIEPRSGAMGKPSPAQTVPANAFGTARVQLATGQTKYTVTVDAPEYDLYAFDLPTLDAFFPSGNWLKGNNNRRYPLRPDNIIELMVTLEP